MGGRSGDLGRRGAGERVIGWRQDRSQAASGVGDVCSIGNLPPFSRVDGAKRWEALRSEVTVHL